MSELEELHESVEIFDLDAVTMNGTDANSRTLSDSFIQEEAILSEEEREEILKDIEDVVAENRIHITKDLFDFQPVKKGYILPVLNFLLMISLVTAVILFSTRFFENEKAELNVETSGYLSTEGQLLEELRRSSEEALATKEQEISDIQSQLAQLDAESQSLRENIESTIQEREAELRRQLEAELAEERLKLQAEGRSAEYIERELQTIESRKTDQISAELDAFKAQAAESIREKEEELARARRITEDILRQANEEKARLVEETQQREEELTREFEEERQALIAQSSEASRRLEEIARQQENENLITDQIIAGYNSVIRNMQQEDYTAATAAIEQIRSILNDPRIETLPRISKRKPVETFILNTLEDEIDVETASPDDTPTAMVQAAERLFRARGLVSRAETAESGGDTEAAEALYSEAISTVPELEKAVTNLRSIQSQQRNQIASRFADEGSRLIREGNISAAARQLQDAAEAYARTPEETEQISGIFSSYSTGVEELSSQSRTELSRQLEEQEAAYNELQQKYENDIAALEEQLASVEGRVDAAELEEALQQIQNLETSLSSAEERREELSAQLNEANETIAALEAAAEAPTTETETTVSDTEEIAPELLAEYEAQEALIARLNEEMEALANERETMEAEAESYRSRIEELETQIESMESLAVEEGSAVSAEMLTYREQIEELTANLGTAETRIETLQGNLNTATENIAALRRELQNERAAAADVKERLEKEIAVLEEEKKGLQEDLDAAVLELVNFVTTREGDERYASLALLYNEYRLRIESLMASDDYQEADILLTRFFNEDSVSGIFPGIGTITSEIDKYIREREKESSLTAGRRSALTDVLTAADYLSTAPRRNMNETPLGPLIESEPRFEEAVKAIQELAVQNLKERVSSQSAQGIFIGSISSISGDRIVIESLSLDEIAPGTPIVIKRFTSSGDTVIARGEIRSQRGARVVAEVTEPTGTPPRTVDLVYTDVQD